ncbi:hypothetical protein BJ138DRAFT_1100332 [Hygrophoropsis aurantiaca]|uniref:Uncharacterized protein n=1 Tax=Hygrophoropsis aurantiaca TaxID=72124 RepID=A0ACB8AHD7_9AGAM|nr:hypothetical protein BJ138DRAFT_1100332 [Hygrophoropsis aurantiaca]
MAHSLSPECTPLKHAYDSCFNTWFEAYLDPHPTNPSASSSHKSTSPQSTPLNATSQAAYAKAQAAEFEARCGRVWREYRACVMKAVHEKGLGELLEQARAENPLKTPPDVRRLRVSANELGMSVLGWAGLEMFKE